MMLGCSDFVEPLGITENAVMLVQGRHQQQMRPMAQTDPNIKIAPC